MSEIQKTIYTHRLLAKVVLQAETPLAISSGEKNVLTDAPVMLDANGLPYIPATSIAGIIRHTIGDEKAKQFFGYQTLGVDRDGEGSKIIFSSAHIIGEQGEVIDGLQNIDFKSNYYKHFNVLPIRQHVRINSAGTAEDGGKFDEQIIYKGTRFCFEIEMVASDNSINMLDQETDQLEHDNKLFDNVLNQLSYNTFRVGGGSRSGFGSVSVVSYKKAVLNLTTPAEMKLYLKKSSFLSDNEFWAEYASNTTTEIKSPSWTVYKLQLIPENFFLFGSGFGNDNADMTPVKESVIEWDNNNIPHFNKKEEKHILFPASSIKGALTHRVAFYYNKFNNIVADTLSVSDMKQHIGKNNKAIKQLFGSEGGKNPEENAIPGNIILSDIIMKPCTKSKTKILNHVSIDRFTGGATPGALFSEEVIYKDGQMFEFTILVKKSISLDKQVEKALEKALQDVCCCMLPLGGGTNRGNGCFTGNIKKDGSIIYSYTDEKDRKI